jgi:2-methylcitrate dehydratase PrpD
MRDGSVFKRHKTDYEGFVTNPMRWETVRAKFDRLATPYCEASLRNEIADCVAELDSLKTAELTRLLAQVSPTQTTQP